MEATTHGYTTEDLMKLDPASLRAILRERTHHTIEVMIYRILNGKMKKPLNFGFPAKQVPEIWKKRRLPTDSPDIQWCMRYVKLADDLNAGKKVDT